MMKITENSSLHNCKGSFTIELALVLIVLIALFYFMTDLSHKLIIRAQLDRASFSIVNVLKERTRFYDERFNLSQQDLVDMQSISSRLLNTNSSNVAIQIESLQGKTIRTVFASPQYGTLGCTTLGIDQKTLLVPEEDGVIFPLYQVSLCVESDSWFSRVWGDPLSSTMVVSSSSVMVGR
ncbi:tight adherence pilus pseudopilin TadF [Vibrio splendidus]|uniref:tight adherence pilus pseudopilin TadF n=1 Tax=Vibrio splendidus TaxID=29497 RepID=UPI0021B1A0D3|nr:tight adherence pilus pseudopilin TadF [Vibrio splendidus]